MRTIEPAEIGVRARPVYSNARLKFENSPSWEGRTISATSTSKAWLGRLGLGAVCWLLLGCPDNQERARLEAIRSFEGIIPELVVNLRDEVFPGAKGRPVAEDSAVPTRYLKNLDYHVDATSVSEYPFLGTLRVELGGEGIKGEDSEGRFLEQRYLVSLDFVETERNWKLYYSRVLSPTGLSDATDSAELSRVLEETLDSWRLPKNLSSPENHKPPSD